MIDLQVKVCRRGFMAHGKLSIVKSGSHRRLAIEGPEYEPIYALDGIRCLARIEETAYSEDISENLGLHTISGGNMATLNIEMGIQV